MQTAFDAAVLDWDGATKRTLFGCPAYQARGTLFALLAPDGIAVTRLTSDQRDRLERSFETGPFKSGEWRVTKWPQVSVDSVAELEEFLPYVHQSYETALEEREW